VALQKARNLLSPPTTVTLCRITPFLVFGHTIFDMLLSHVISSVTYSRVYGMYDYFTPHDTETLWKNFEVVGIRFLQRIALRVPAIYASWEMRRCETLLWCETNKEYIVKKE